MAQNSDQHQGPDLTFKKGSMDRTKRPSDSSMKTSGGHVINEHNDRHISSGDSNHGLEAMPDMVSTDMQFRSPSSSDMTIVRSPALKNEGSNDLEQPAVHTTVDRATSVGHFIQHNMLKEDEISTRSELIQLTDVSERTETGSCKQNDSYMRQNSPSFIPLPAPVPVRRPRLFAESQTTANRNISPMTKPFSLRPYESKIHPIDVPYDRFAKLPDRDMLARLPTLQFANAAELHNALLSAHEARKAKELSINETRSEILSLLLTAREKEHQHDANKHMLFYKFVKKMSTLYSHEDKDGSKESVQLEAIELLKVATKVSLRVTEYRGAVDHFRDQLLELDNDRTSAANDFADTVYELVTNHVDADATTTHVPGPSSVQEHVGQNMSTKALKKRKGSRKTQPLSRVNNSKAEGLFNVASKQAIVKQQLHIDDVPKISDEPLDHADTTNKATNVIATLYTDHARQQKSQKKQKPKGEGAGKSAIMDNDASLSVTSNVD